MSGQHRRDTCECGGSKIAKAAHCHPCAVALRTSPPEVVQERRRRMAPVYRRRWFEQNRERALESKRASDRRRYAIEKENRPPRLSRRRPPEMQFLDRLIRQGNGCVFLGTGKPDNYPNLRVDGKWIKGNRFAWEFYHGPIPEGMCVLHRCDTPRCVAEAHLFLGTMQDNSRDMMAKGRGRAQWTSLSSHI